MTSGIERVRRGLLALVRRRHVTREIDEEFETHIAFATDELIAQGVPLHEARRRALVAFGGVQQTKEAALRGRAFSWVPDVARDLRFALRRMHKEPVSNLAIIVVVGLGIGAVTTVFSFMNSVWLRPLPYADSDRLVVITSVAPDGAIISQVPADLADGLRRLVSDHAEIAAYDERAQSLTIRGTDTRGTRTALDSAAFDLLRAKPVLGRLPAAAEYRTNAPVALVSDSLWRTSFSDAPDLRDATIDIGGREHRIIGVMPPGFVFHSHAMVWTPLAPVTTALDTAALHQDGPLARPLINVVIRLRSGVTPEALTATIAERLSHSTIRDSLYLGGWQFPAGALHERARGPAGYSVAALAFLVTAIVLVVACANVMNILLARAAYRRRVLALSAALGATSSRLLRQLLVEHAVLGLAAGVLGMLLSATGVRLLLALVPRQGFPGWLSFGVDWRVLVFAFVISLATMLVFGLLPAREGARVDPLRAIQDGEGAGITARDAGLRSARLVRVQLALSFALVVCSALLVAGYRSLLDVDTPYAAERMLQVEPLLDGQRPDDPGAPEAFAHALADRLAASDTIRLAGSSRIGALRGIAVDSAPRAARREPWVYAAGDSMTRLGRATLRQPPDWHVVSDTYLAQHGRQLLHGRTFDATDQADREPVVVISAALARALWGTDVPIGDRITPGRTGPALRIIGVVDDRVVIRGVGGRLSRTPAYELFLSERQAYASNTRLIVETRAPAAEAAALIRAAAREVDPFVHIPPIRSLAETARQQLLPLRILADALAFMTLVTLLIASVGLYGLVRYTTAQRSREISIRLALGATPRQILALLMMQSFRTMRSGLIAGGLLAALLAALLAWGILSGLPAPAGVMWGAGAIAAIALAGIVGMACWLPARRAARANPNDALRSI